MFHGKACWVGIMAAVLVTCGLTGVAEAAGNTVLPLARSGLGPTGTGLLLIAVGGFSIGGGACAWPFFMNHRKARFMVSLIGEKGARGLYVAVGIAMVIIGVMNLTSTSTPGSARANQSLDR